MILPKHFCTRRGCTFPAFEAEVKISPIEKGGSGRKFYRIQFSPEQTVVLVKYTREQAENQRYVEIAEFLATHDVRAPKIYFHDPEEGLIWIEDLGERDLWSHREESWPVRRALYRVGAGGNREAASHSGRRIPRSFAADLPAQFDAALYLWEQHYFFEHCLGRHFGVDGRKRAELARLPALQEIAERLGTSRVFWCIAIFNRKTSSSATARLT